MGQTISTQRVRFRGAVLGLMLTPVAVSLMPIRMPMSRADADGADKARSVIDEVLQFLQERVDYCALQVRLFLSAEAVGGEANLQDKTQDKTWLDAVPMLLRYYDHPNRYRLWQAGAAATAQYWFLSDILALAMSGQSMDRDWLRRRPYPSGAAQASETVRHYQWLWHALTQQLADSSNMRWQSLPREAALHEAIPHEMAPHRDVVIGVACALAGIANGPSAVSGSYSLSVSMAAQQISANASWQAPLIAGLVSGAIVGHAALPVLWQQTHSLLHLSPPISSPGVEVGVAMADALFRRWAGVMSTSVPMSAPC